MATAMMTPINNPALDALKQAVEGLELTQEDLSNIMGRAQPTISDIMQGKRAISAELAVELEEALQGKVQASNLLSLQSEYQIALARQQVGDSAIRLKAKIQEEFPIQELEKRGWINRYKNVAEKLKAVLEFADNSPDLDQIKSPTSSQVLARQSLTLGHLSPTGKANRAWLFRVKELASITPVRDFVHERFVEEGMPEIRALARNEKDVAQVPQALARYGVRFVVVEHMPKTKLEGAIMWLDQESEKMPVIALTMRYGHLDKFWFTLAHELHHIKYKHKLSIDQDISSYDEENNPCDNLAQIEAEATAGAAEWLIPQARLHSFISRHRSRYSQSSLSAFSKLVNVHPSTLLGALQHLGEISQGSALNSLKVDIRQRILLGSMADGHRLPKVETNRTLIGRKEKK